MEPRHAPLRAFLASAGVEYHAKKLIDEGFETLRELVDARLTAADLTELGFKMRPRKQLLSAIEKLEAGDGAAAAAEAPPPASVEPRVGAAAAAASPPRNATPPDAPRAEAVPPVQQQNAEPSRTQTAALGALSEMAQGRAGDTLRDIDRLLAICAAAGGVAPPAGNPQTDNKRKRIVVDLISSDDEEAASEAASSPTRQRRGGSSPRSPTPSRSRSRSPDRALGQLSRVDTLELQPAGRKVSHLQIPEAIMEQVTGSGGFFLKSVEEFTAVSLSLPPFTPSPRLGTPRARLLTLEGPIESVDAAAHMISSQISSIQDQAAAPLACGSPSGVAKAAAAAEEFFAGQKSFQNQLWRMAIAHFSVSLSLGHPDPPSVHCCQFYIKMMILP